MAEHVVAELEFVTTDEGPTPRKLPAIGGYPGATRCLLHRLSPQGWQVHGGPV